MTFGKTIKLRKAQHQVLDLVDNDGGEVSEEGEEEAKDSASTCRRWQLSWAFHTSGSKHVSGRHSSPTKTPQ